MRPSATENSTSSNNAELVEGSKVYGMRKELIYYFFFGFSVDYRKITVTKEGSLTENLALITT